VVVNNASSAHRAESSRADGTGVISSIGNACVRFSTAAAVASAATELYRILCMEHIGVKEQGPIPMLMHYVAVVAPRLVCAHRGETRERSFFKQ